MMLLGAFALPLVYADLRFGQANALIALGLVLAWNAYREGKSRSAGMWLGAVASLKLIPLLLIVPLMRRDRRAALWAILAALIVSVSAVLTIGVGPSFRWATEAAPVNLKQWGNMGFTVAGLATRLSGEWQQGLALGLVPIAMILVVRKSWWAALAIAIVCAPLGWPMYGVILLPGLVDRARTQPGWAAATVAALSGACLTNPPYALYATGILTVLAAGLTWPATSETTTVRAA